MDLSNFLSGKNGGDFPVGLIFKGFSVWISIPLHIGANACSTRISCNFAFSIMDLRPFSCPKSPITTLD
ncbi:hypothetical protein OCA8868_00931 [Octadecabacter ascidiaceicola]|uniref:Uncharacterized protein n=1 Tax=Octadecabacter ascidiaceicola TaxID=1655543 RepID=A0A238JRL5_9RHOB|nr:hypothetical protein OCA8868_00931 [Octadecabacter ascidiaceicola]